MKASACNHVQVIRTYSGTIAESLTDPIMNEMYDEMQEYIITNIVKPIDHLLVYLDREINGEDNKALQVWRVRISHPSEVVNIGGHGGMIRSLQMCGHF